MGMILYLSLLHCRHATGSSSSGNAKWSRKMNVWHMSELNGTWTSAMSISCSIDHCAAGLLHCCN